MIARYIANAVIVSANIIDSKTITTLFLLALNLYCLIFSSFSFSRSVNSTSDLANFVLNFLFSVEPADCFFVDCCFVAVFEPLVLLIAVNLLLRLTAAISQPFGDGRISDCLEETAGNLQYCMAGILFTAFLYFLSIMLMVCASEALF